MNVHIYFVALERQSNHSQCNLRSGTKSHCRIEVTIKTCRIVKLNGKNLLSVTA